MRIAFLILLLSAKISASAQCNAAFTANVNGANVQFIPAFNLPSSRFFWNFGDGQTSTASAPVHTYNFPGVYNVQHIVRDSLNTCADTFLLTVLVNFNITCQASFNIVPDTFHVNSFTFISTSSYTGTGIQQYTWTIDGVNVPGSSNYITYNFTPGNHNVCLSILTYNGCTSSVCQTINIPPPQNCTWQAAFTSSASASNPRLISFVASPVQSSMRYRWTFGDGGSSIQRNPQHLYYSAGTYHVKLEIVDTTSGCSDSVAHNLVVQGSLCDTAHCSTSFTPNPALPGQYFFNASCNLSQGAQRWDIYKQGDSLFHVILNANNPAYTFTDSGYYFICLSVRLQDSCNIHTCSWLHVPVGHHRPNLPAIPNPAVEIVNFYLQLDAAEQINIVIFNQNGRTVYRSAMQGRSGNNTISVPVRSLASGLYFAEIQTRNRKERSKFLKL